MSTTCFICVEYYKRDMNPAMTLLPCGHVACDPCMITWRKQNNTCPECRKPIQNTIINRALMDLIEENKMNKVDTKTQNIINKPHYIPDNTTSFSTPKKLDSKLFKKPLTTKDRNKEIIKDKCEIVIYIIDNSGSMEAYNDGKIFINNNNKIIKKNGVLRWHEACSKIKKIATYNIARKICAAYYLLNPVNESPQENIDFVVIDPQNNNDITARKYNILIDNMLQQENVRGNTPLDVVTRYFGRNLHRFIDNKIYKNKPICYNIITDGEPNNKSVFEKELKYLANNYNIFLVINLCTEDDNIVEYYNDLDKHIGNELSGFDVIDDLESEQKEIISAGNGFFVYSENIHICRMAGCYSIIADVMDEQKLSVFHSCKLCNELCDIQSNNMEIPGYNDRKNYIKYIKTKVNMKPKVYDFGKKTFLPIVDVDKLDSWIWYNESTNNMLESVLKRVGYFMHSYPLVSVVLVVLLLCLCVYYG